jgi:stage IV sporulation protein FB
MRLGRVMGVNLRVHYLFLLPLFAWAATGQLAQGLLAFLAVFLHEMGHLSRARALGLTPQEVVLLPFGGVASLEEDIGLEPLKETQVALAGPWVNVVIIGAVLVWRAVFGGSPILDFFLETNIMLATFNLLPALPLDGGRVFRARLVRDLGFRAGTIRAARVSGACGILFLLLGIGLFWFSNQSLNLLVMAVFLIISSQTVRKQATYQLLAYLSGKQREMAISGSVPVVPLVVPLDARGGDLVQRLVPQKYHLFYVLDVSGNLRGIVTEQRLVQALLQSGLEVKMRQLID